MSRLAPPYLLGISAFYHDSAAALLRGPAIVAAAQEERFSRRKHDERFPSGAIDFCLRHAGITAADLGAVVFYDKPIVKFARMLETYLSIAPAGWRTFGRVVPGWLAEKLELRGTLRRKLAGLPGDCPLLFTEHHQAHAASAFFPSPFRDAAILTVDGVGEWATTVISRGDGADLQPLVELRFPHSLGLLYSAFTTYCGFRVNSGEYKLMGLAPYGEPEYASRIRDHLIDLRADGSFRLDLACFEFLRGTTMTNERFHALFGGPPRKPEEPPNQRHCDVARSIQVVTEEVMLRLARQARHLTGQRRLCLAGGVALNCVANGRILRECIFDELWIQPAAGDAGGALGAALAAWHGHFQQPRGAPGASAGDHLVGRSDAKPRDSRAAVTEPGGTAVCLATRSVPSAADGEERTAGGTGDILAQYDAMQGALLGPEFSDAEIRHALEARHAVFVRHEWESLLDETVRLLAAGRVLGWFQGRMEFGPRALGNRSILGDPRSPRMQSVMNLKVKFRESFRPFAPAVLREHAAAYFDLPVDSPYMLLVASVRPELRRPPDRPLAGLERLKHAHSTIPAVTHVDYSARVQTVEAETNPRFHALLARFAAVTGCHVLVNTSFNVRGEPIVCSPDDAYRCFLHTEMDALVVGNYLLDRRAQPPPTDVTPRDLQPD